MRIPRSRRRVAAIRIAPLLIDARARRSVAAIDQWFVERIHAATPPDLNDLLALKTKLKRELTAVAPDRLAAAAESILAILRVATARDVVALVNHGELSLAAAGKQP